jgi:hypothetical protein
MLYGDSNSNLWVSEIGKPDYVQGTSYVQIGDPNERIMKIVVYADVALIVKKNSVWSFGF